MSVIMAGIKSDKLYLGADNRTTTIETASFRDNATKIVIVNDSVAVACAGYANTQERFARLINGSKKKNVYTVESIILWLKYFYWVCKVSRNNEEAKKILHLGSQFIIAGKNRKNKYCICVMAFSNGKLEVLKEDGFIFSPSDVSSKRCWDLYTINKVTYNDFIQKTVKDISRISKEVSPSGDMWVYDMTTERSSMVHFN